MRRLDMKLLFAVALVLALTAPALAQEPAAATPATAPEAAPGATDATRPPLDVELETGGYAYNSRGPARPVREPAAAGGRRPGAEDPQARAWKAS